MWRRSPHSGLRGLSPLAGVGDRYDREKAQGRTTEIPPNAHNTIQKWQVTPANQKDNASLLSATNGKLAGARAASYTTCLPFYVKSLGMAGASFLMSTGIFRTDSARCSSVSVTLFVFRYAHNIQYAAAQVSISRKPWLLFLAP